ncbi:unnamed protein product [Gongylonema pulchrum]|uniref:Uncharacterized protein n=1 Tax=Gongylonema pulchrum TaxID=637853 RepID=A0A183EH35_9BILA|nr:unnamed protein product [Gongylonema pulchrum]
MSSAPTSKRAKFDNCVSAVDLSIEQKIKSNRHAENNRKVKENFWPDDHPDARTITDQIGLMLLLDEESPTKVNRTGFRNLLRHLQPKYQLPSAEEFQEVVLPRLCDQLKSNLSGVLHSNDKQHEMRRRLDALAATLLAQKQSASATNFITTGSEFLSTNNTMHNEQVCLHTGIVLYGRLGFMFTPIQTSKMTCNRLLRSYC